MTMSLSAGVPIALLIFLAEMSVVTLSTIRIIFVTRGQKYLAPLLGACEIMIWLFAMGQIMQNLSDVSCYLAFAGGFTAGNFVGILLEQKLALGSVVVRVITARDARPLVADLRAARFGVTSVEGRGTTGPVRIVLSIIQRRELANLVALIHRFDPKAFYSVDELQSVAQGVFPKTGTRPWRGWRGGPWGITDPLSESEVLVRG